MYAIPPAAEAIVDGRNAQYVVRFDGWVDHGASQMNIAGHIELAGVAGRKLDREMG